MAVVPRPHYYARPMRFGSRGPGKFSRPFVSDTSPKCIDREGLERRRTGTRQVVAHLNSLKRPAEHSERTISFFLRETNPCLVLTGQVESNCVKPDSIFLLLFT